MTSAFKLRGKSKDSYMQCISEILPLRSIKNDKHLAVASSVLDKLLSMDRDAGQDEYLDALTDLVEAYEGEHVHIDESTPSEMLAHLIEARGITQATVAKNAGISRSTVSEIYGGKDKISKAIAFKLADYFGVSPVLFLR